MIQRPLIIPNTAHFHSESTNEPRNSWTRQVQPATALRYVLWALQIAQGYKEVITTGVLGWRIDPPKPPHET
jgi:hypothetical protein